MATPWPPGHPGRHLDSPSTKVKDNDNDNMMRTTMATTMKVSFSGVKYIVLGVTPLKKKD